MISDRILEHVLALSVPGKGPGKQVYELRGPIDEGRIGEPNMQADDVVDPLEKWLREKFNIESQSFKRCELPFHICVEGHADEGIDSEDLQVDLSMQRAFYVAGELRRLLQESLSRRKVCLEDAFSITCRGSGSVRKVSEEFGESWRNRRVCVYIL
jgi:hypothetical protein